MTAPMTVALASEAETVALGAKIGALAARGDMIALRGALGAGKTSLARGIIRARLPTADDVPSPTFTLVQVYDDAVVPIFHFDLYRLTSPEDALELGLDDALAQGIAIVEWPERLGGRRIGNTLDIALSIDGATRRAVLSGDESWRDRLASLP